MIINKQHSDRDHPPNIPMIMEPEKKNKMDVRECLADCAVAIVKALCALAPSMSSTHTADTQHQPSAQVLPGGMSPGKKVNLRSQYLSQLKTLQNLRDDGVLTLDEFQSEKVIILESLKTLQ